MCRIWLPFLPMSIFPVAVITCCRFYRCLFFRCPFYRCRNYRCPFFHLPCQQPLECLIFNVQGSPLAGSCLWFLSCSGFRWTSQLVFWHFHSGLYSTTFTMTYDRLKILTKSNPRCSRSTRTNSPAMSSFIAASGKMSTDEHRLMANCQLYSND